VIGIIEYEMGNVQSVLNAFEHIGAPARIVDDPDGLGPCSKIVLPGVGAFGAGMAALRRLGFADALRRDVLIGKKPFLGICLGMQLICRESHEFGRHDGLGWIDAVVKRIPDEGGLRVPHVGWDDIKVTRNNRLVDLSGGINMYFVHSYYVDLDDKDLATATCFYGLEFAAMLEKDNIFAAQFHPEKSQAAGVGMLMRFAGI
jgi:glutamine amidotransferase